MPTVHNIDFKQLNEFAHIGVRRAIIFLGLGLNAAQRPDFLDYELSKLAGAPAMPIQFFPDNLPLERVAEFKSQFAIWIRDCCLCDLLGHYALFLDRMHEHALIVHQVTGKLGKEESPATIQKKVGYLGIPGKHESLRKRFGIDPKHTSPIDRLYEARNAFQHHFGAVHPKMCDANGDFSLAWPTFNVMGIGSESGTERPIGELIGVHLEEDTDIVMRVGERTKTFAVGDRIDISRDDLPEICHFLATLAIPAALSAFLEFLRASGILMNDKAVSAS